MKMNDRIEELEKRVRELEARPVFVPMPYYAPFPATPVPYFHPQHPYAPYSTTTCELTITGGPLLYVT